MNRNLFLSAVESSEVTEAMVESFCDRYGKGAVPDWQAYIISSKILKSIRSDHRFFDYISHIQRRTQYTSHDLLDIKFIEMEADDPPMTLTAFGQYFKRETLLSKRRWLYMTADKRIPDDTDMHYFGPDWVHLSPDVKEDFNIDFQGEGWYVSEKREFLYVIGPNASHNAYRCLKYSFDPRETLQRMAHAPVKYYA